MIIQYASDLHLEFPENKEFLSKNPLEPIGDVLLLAGDIVPFAIMDKYNDFFSYVSDHFESTYWIPGNHEYYHSDLADRCGKFHEKIRSNVHLLNNTVIKRDNVDLIFSSLWTKLSPAHQGMIERIMNDFKIIKYKGNRFTTDQYNHLHDESVNFLKQALDLKTNKSVVISHHVPTFYNHPERVKGFGLSEAFAVELIDLIKEFKPDYWIYGHIHGKLVDFNFENTQILTNPLGYIKKGEHHLYKSNKSFQIDGE